MSALNVLVVEADRGAARDAVDALHAAGHRVLSCYDDGAPSFPCHALDPAHGCPLDTATVDVALTVRGRARSQPAPHEHGVTCALQRRVPVAVAGETMLHPYEGYATVVGGNDVVAACERAAHEPIESLSDAATHALCGVVAEHGGEPGTVRVQRRNGRLVATVHVGPRDPRVRSIAAVRIIAALRAADRYAAGIDVVHD